MTRRCADYAYEVKEAFFAIYALKSRHAAESALAKWEAGGYSTPLPISFFLGAEGEDAAIAAVASSAFMVIGVLLGWLFLRQKVSSFTGLGLAWPFSGIALLLALG